MSERHWQVLRLVLASTLGALAVTCAQPANEVDIDLLRGRNAQLLSRHDWARSYFAEDLKRHPQRLESMRGVGVGWISGFEGSMTKAIDAFESYLEAVPDDGEIRIRLARALLIAGQDAEAAAVLRALPPSTEADILVAESALRQDPRFALSRLEKVLRSDPTNLEANHLASRAYEHLGEPEKALDALARSRELKPLDPKQYYTTAQILYRLGRDSEAEDALAVYRMVSQLPKPGRPVSPVEELRVLRQIQNHLGAPHPVLQRRLAKALIQAGDTQSARPLIATILQSDASNEFIIGLGQAAHTRGSDAIARELYDTVLANEPTHLQALSSRARLASELGEYAIAEEMVQRGLDVEPHFAPLHFVAGMLSLARNNDDEAQGQFERAVELVPWLPRYRLTLADLYLTTGDLDAATELLQQGPPDPRIEEYKERHSL